MIRVYGLKNCDTCRRTLRWLAERELPHRFHDVRKDGFGDLDSWIAICGHETLINRRGTTWRNLPGSARLEIDNERAAALIRAWPALMKRPLFVVGGRVLVGFTAATRSVLGDAPCC